MESAATELDVYEQFYTELLLFGCSLVAFLFRILSIEKADMRRGSCLDNG